MSQLGEPYRVPLVNLREGDFGVAVGFPIAGLVIASVTVPALTVPLVGLGALIGVIAVYAAPPHLTAWTWLRDLSHYYGWQPRYTLTAPDETDGTAGGAAAYNPFTPDERTQSLTQIHRAWPGAAVLERSDGGLEAFLRVTPANMDFAMSGDWEAVQAAGERFTNAELTFPLTLYTTTQSFPAESLVTRLDAESSATSTAVLTALREEYHQRRPTELAATRQHHYYLGVAVAPSAVSTEPTAATPAARLRSLPVVGWLLGAVAGGHTTSEGRQRQAQYDELERRCATVEQELIGEVPGWDGSRLSTLELFVLAAEFWNGVEYTDPDRLLADTPVTGPATRREETEGGA